jgi:hypothetical protein
LAFPSTFLDLQNIVIADLRLDTVADRQKVKDQINRYYLRLVENEALQMAWTTALTPGVGSYLWPAPVRRINEICAAAAGSSGYGAPLQEVAFDQILDWRQSGTAAPVANATCTHYAFVGHAQIEFYPAPAAADTLLIYGTQDPTPMSADTDVPQIGEPYATDLLTYGPCFELAMFKSDPGAADWQTLYTDANRRYTRHLNRKRSGDTRQLRVQGTTRVSVSRDTDTG